MGWTSTRISVAHGAQLHVELSGSGPAVVFLHGIGGRARQWRNVVRHLAPSASAIAWDARGYGESTGPGAMDFADFADDLIAVLDALGVERALAVGHSMGGRILIEAAVRWPARFGGLFLSGAPAAYLPHLSMSEREGYIARRLDMFSDGVVAPEKARAVAREVLPRRVSAAVLAELAEDFRALRPEGYGAALSASLGWDRTADLAALSMPCELMTGALDKVCPPATFEALADVISPERLSILPGVAHLAQLEAPEQVADLVSRFVQRNAAQASRVSAHGMQDA